MASPDTKKIAVVSGGRADYDLLYRVMVGIRDDAALNLQLIVTGAHLSGVQGDTLSAIAGDGLTIDARVPCTPQDDSKASVVRAMGHAVAGFADAYDQLHPDIVVVLGDRYEILAAAQAAALMRIPVAHIHGGEITEGAFDDAIRHAITKLSTYHFTAAEAYRTRVVQMGEQPQHVWNVGALGIDNIRHETLLGKDDLARELGIDLSSPLFVVTYHPVTMAADDGLDGARAMIKALEAQSDAHCIVTGVNADPAHKAVADALDAFVARTAPRTVFVPTLGRVAYLSVLACADAVIGNSSSGIIEAPSLGVPTINIGPRQDGRLRAPSVIDCAAQADAISAALVRALSADMKKTAKQRANPCAQDETAQSIVDRLAAVVPVVEPKVFFDVEFVGD